ncbi:MAG: DUF4175 family protein [Alphaproteobacteria bacterium]|nr:DUF4175 family protein [Alphaproteobacteria bacterium]
MPDHSQNKHHAKALAKLKRQKHLARGILLLESLSECLWRPFFWTLFFFGLWLFQIPALLGQIPAILVTLSFCIGIAYLLIKDLPRFSWPGDHAVTRRLEIDSGVKHRPLSSMSDQLANPDKEDTQELWASNKDKLFGFLNLIKLKAPRAMMAQKDPYALRYLAGALFVLGLIVAGPLWQARIWNGLSPVDIELNRKLTSGIMLQITPPAYTQNPQMVLRQSSEKVLNIPQGSTLKATVSDRIGTPVLRVDERDYPMQKEADHTYTLEMDIPAGSALSIRQMLFPRAAWRYQFIPDQPPSIAAKGEPEILPDGALRFGFTLKDDYSVKDLQMHMRLDPELGEAPMGEPISETRTVFSPAQTDFEIAPLYDLTGHPWAGLPVVFEFTALDHLGQKATTNPIRLTLPERSFAHPVAQKIIDIRKKLIAAPNDSYRDMAIALEDIMAVPGAYQNDIYVFLNLRSASSRLFYNDPSLETSRAVVNQLWNVALRIEDGNLSFAARNLRDAQQALQKALQNPDTSEQEIAQLMNTLREAMAEYFTELQKEAQKRMSDGGPMPMIPPEMLRHLITPEGLGDFLSRMESQMLSGDRHAAQQMLSELQRMMDTLDPSVTAPMPADMQMMAEGVSKLQEIIEAQQALLEKTAHQAKLAQEFELLKDKMPDGFMLPEINTTPSVEQQDAIRHELEDLIMEAVQKLQDVPDGMALGDQEMEQSAQALGENAPDISSPHQEKAIEHLKSAQEKLSEQFTARMENMTGMMFGSGTRYDPLGRPYRDPGSGDGGDGSQVKVPSDAEQKRAREILDLLRRRSGERDRPMLEREYYRRLLKQF